MTQEIECPEPEELDLGSIAGIAAAKDAGLVPERFHQSRTDYEAQVAAFRAEHWRTLTSLGRHRRERRPARCGAPRGQRGRRARRHAATTLRDDGDGSGGEPAPHPDSARSLWRACRHLSGCRVFGPGEYPPPARRGFGVRPRDAVVAAGPRVTVDTIADAFDKPFSYWLDEQRDRTAHAGTEGDQR
jgi:hypothetical protein